MTDKKIKNRLLMIGISLLGVLTTLPLQSFAEVNVSEDSDNLLSSRYSFTSIWKLVREKSPDIKAAGSELEGARIYQTRTSRHWYPRVFAEGRVYSTNDPTLSFISLLGQRQITSQDFAAQTLNQPGSNFFERGTLGLDLPLYEGGSKVAIFSAASKMAEAKAYELKSTEIAQYTDIASTYSSLLSLKNQQKDLEKLLSDIEATLAQYKIGSKSNPVGYSGLLGLKTLRNRLQGLLTENVSKATALREHVRIVAEELPESWTPKFEPPRDFILAHLNPNTRTKESTNNNTVPASVRAMHLAAEALDQAKAAEKARFLPKVGLFGTGDLYGGSRGTGTSYTGGAYLQWELFSASNFGATSQAEHSAAAAHARAEGMNEKTRMERSRAIQTANTLENNLILMEESTKLLEEQTATAKDLFRNGSINALQLVEVIARRVDLVVSRTEAQIGLAQARATLWVNSDLEGASYEN